MSVLQNVGDIQETRNYDIFKLVKGNREINRSHVNRLKEKISRRDLKEIPITCGSADANGVYPIFDGQHRFMAKKELGKPIRFIVTKNMRADDISELNTDTSNWNQKNFLKKWVDKGLSDYIYFKIFIEEYGLENKFSVAITLLNNSFRRERTQEEVFVNGLFKVVDKEESENTIRFINRILTEIDSSKCKNSFFYYAILHVINHPGFDRNHFIRKVEKLSAKFKGATNSQEWVDIMDKVYNKHNQGIKKFKPIRFRDFKTNS